MGSHARRTLMLAAGIALAFLLAAAAAVGAGAGAVGERSNISTTAGAVSGAGAAGVEPVGVEALASAGPRLSARPNPVSFGRPLTIAGHGWPVIEFCERKVRLSLRSPQNVFTIGTARVGLRGGFRRTWTPRRAEVGAGRWRLVARMRCESGRDGSAVPVVRSLTLRIR